MGEDKSTSIVWRKGMKRQLQIQFFLVFLCLLSVLCDSAKVANELEGTAGEVLNTISNTIRTSNYSPKIDLDVFPRVTVGIVFVVAGVMFMFLGKYLLRAIFFLAGGLLFSVVTFMVLQLALGLEHGQEPPQSVLIAVLIAGIVGGMIAMFVIKVGIVVLGGFLGSGLALLLIRLKLVQGKGANVGMSVGFVAACCLLAYIFSGIITTVATSFGGALLFGVGVDFFVETGFADFITKYQFLDNLNPPDGKIGAMMGSVVLLSIISFIQRKISSKS